MEKVLVVEDTKAIQLLIRRQLEKKGYEVIVANNGKEALAEVGAHEDIKLILLDIMMPVLDGKKFLESYGDFCKERGVKICMLTSLCETKVINECVSMGADDYLTKPIDNELLGDKVEALVKNETSRKFATIKTDMKVSFLKDEEEIAEGMIHFLAENRAMISSEALFNEEEILRFYCPRLMEEIEDKFDLIARVLLKRREGTEYYYMLEFIGLTEKKASKIRNLTMSGQEFLEVSENSEDSSDPESDEVLEKE